MRRSGLCALRHPVTRNAAAGRCRRAGQPAAFIRWRGFLCLATQNGPPL